MQNRSLLVVLLMGGLTMIFLSSVLPYAVTWYFLRQNDAANESRLSVGEIREQFLETRNVDRDFLLGNLKDKDFYELGQSPNLAKHAALMASLSGKLEGLRSVA